MSRSGIHGLFLPGSPIPLGLGGFSFIRSTLLCQLSAWYSLMAGCSWMACIFSGVRGRSIPSRVSSCFLIIWSGPERYPFDGAGAKVPVKRASKSVVSAPWYFFMGRSGFSQRASVHPFRFARGRVLFASHPGWRDLQGKGPSPHLDRPKGRIVPRHVHAA